MKTKEQGISKKDKLLTVIYEMSSGKQNILKYEDVVVKVFKKYPEDFHMRGYAEYPDSSNQSFYSLRKDGFIQIRNKFISLTDKGITYTKQIIKTKSKPQHISNKLSRDVENEINRIKNTEAFKLFVTDSKVQIVDTDFFSYLGTTVRTERIDFSARIKTIQDVIENLKSMKTNPIYKIIVDLHNYLIDKFKDVINTKLSIGFPRRKHE